MDLASSRAAKDIFARYDLKPKYGLGQNFLADQSAIKKILTAADIQSEDTVLEIGPGIGALTQELAKKAKYVIAVEKDRKMVEVLRETLSDFKNIEVIHSDILKVNLSHIPTLQHSYKLVANLPYYITAPTIRKFLEEEVRLHRAEARLRSMTLVVQKEVAQRICAKPPNMSILAVAVQVYALPKVISSLKKTSFWPQPKVDSAILRITPIPQPYPLDFPKFFTVVKAGFKQPRKQIVNNLSAGLGLSREQAEQWLLQNSIAPTRRAETLTIQDWVSLAKNLPDPSSRIG